MISETIYTVEEIADRVRDLFTVQGVRRAWLFGSYASGKPTAKSDVDMVAEFAEKKPFFELCGLQYEVWERLGKEAD